jgi:hypothetical protein
LIESEGLSTLCFGSAEEFLDSGVQNEAGCLIADIRMPSISGIELQSRLKADRKIRRASAPIGKFHVGWRIDAGRNQVVRRVAASDRTMVATESNRLPNFKSRRTLSLLENEPRERKSNPEKNLSSDREPSANSGLDIETKKLLGYRSKEKPFC